MSVFMGSVQTATILSRFIFIVNNTKNFFSVLKIINPKSFAFYNISARSYISLSVFSQPRQGSVIDFPKTSSGDIFWQPSSM